MANQNDAGEALLAAIQLVPKRIQTVIAVIMAALLISFFGYLSYLYFSGNLW